MPDTDQSTPDPRDAFFDVSNVTENLGRKTGSSAIVVLLFSVLKLVVAIGSTAVLARLITPDQHGLVALALPLVLIATGLSEFGLAQAITQMPKVTHKLASTLFWVNVALGLTLMAAVMALAVPMADFYNQPKVTLIFWVLAPYIFLSVLNTQYMAMLRRQLRVKVIETCVFAATVIAAVISIVLALMGYSITALVAQLLVQQGLTFVMLFAVTGWRPSWPWTARFGVARGALGFGSYLAAERLLNEASRMIQMAIIGRFFGEVSAGLYYRAETFALMPEKRVSSPLSAAFIPSLSRLQDNPADFAAMFRRQVSRGGFILIPIGAFFCACADLVVAILLGPDWVAAGPILAWLGVLPLTGLTLSCMAWSLVASGKSRELFHFRLCNTALIATAILSSFSFGIVPLVAAYVLTVGVVGLLVLSVFVARSTAITPQDIKHVLFENLWFSLLLLAVSFAIRTVMTQSIWVEGLCVGIGICLAMLARLILDKGLRSDVLKVINRKRG